MTTIHPIKLSISNCFLVEGDAKILVDTGSPGEGKKILRALDRLGVSLSDITLILHTHGHTDHCGSTVELLRERKIPTAIHSADSYRIESGKNGLIKTTRLMGDIIKPFVDKPFPAFKADIRLDDLNDLSEFGINGLIHHTPGHTDGSISIEFDNAEAIIGDVIMGGYLGGTFFPHLPDYHYFADDLEEIGRSIRKLMDTTAARFHVGHGGPLKRERIIKRFGL
jgi:glyoxylase-like metal-dependent hydrolase (beta-lactamase superfamily II)